MENGDRSLIFTPQRVIELFRGRRACLKGADGLPDFELADPVAMQTFTREDVIAMLGEIFEGENFAGRRFFYAQDRGLFGYDSEGAGREVVQDVKERAALSLDTLNKVRMVMYEWLLAKGADVLASKQTLYPLVYDAAVGMDHSTKWGAVIGKPDLACKLACAHLFPVGVRYPIEHPNIMDERLERADVEFELAGHALDYDVEECHTAVASNMTGVKNLAEIEEGAERKVRLKILIDGLRGLQHLHDLGLVYCDFKLDQILAVETEYGYIGKLADLETLRPVGHRGDFIANPFVNENFYYAQHDDGVDADAVYFPVDRARDVFSVAVEVITFFMNPHLKSSCLSFVHEFTRSFKTAENQAERFGVYCGFVRYLSQYVPGELAGLLILALSNVREERPALSQIVKLLEEMVDEEA